MSAPTIEPSGAHLTEGRLLSIGELVDAGRLAEAVEREAAACERDGYGDTARLLRALLALSAPAPAPGTGAP